MPSLLEWQSPGRWLGRWRQSTPGGDKLQGGRRDPPISPADIVPKGLYMPSESSVREARSAVGPRAAGGGDDAESFRRGVIATRNRSIASRLVSQPPGVRSPSR